MRFGLARRELLVLVAGMVLAGVAIVPPPVAAHAAEAPKKLSTTFTAADVGFAEGGIRPQMVDKFDAMDAYVGDKKPIVRIDLDWASVEPTDGEFHWDVVDTVVNAANAREMRVLLVLAYSPPWANGGHEWSEGKWFPTDDAAWVDIVSRTVARYGDRVQAYEVWNEPNMSIFGHFEDPAGRETVAARKKRYWELVELAYPRLKAGCPSCPVLAGGSAVGDQPSDPHNNPNTAASWLTAGYDAGAGRFFDAVAHHPYPSAIDGLGPDDSQCDFLFWSHFGPPLHTDPATGKRCGGELALVREVMVARGDSAKQIWGTEWGYPTGGTDLRVRPPLAQIRNFMVEGVYMWRALDYTGPLFLFSLRDTTPVENGLCAQDANGKECRFGVTTAANQPKEPLFTDLSVALRGEWNSQLEPDQVLRRRSELRSPDGRFRLWLDLKGNLVLDKAAVGRAPRKVLWKVDGLVGTRLINQNDANLQLLNGERRSVWNSRTGSGRYTPTRLVLRNDGNLVLQRVSDGVELWSTGTAGK